ncbi:MAG: iron-sulfur cluster assembly protein [Ignavibacteria bacterium]|nr:iron-sulfur cluster assembly protein [Ignavibacteria bacterium]
MNKELDNTAGKKEPVEKTVDLDKLKEEVIKVLKSCYDPEIPVNIYDLGLIYDVKLATNGDVFVVMTLTSPACPVAGSLPVEVQRKLKEHPMVNDAKVVVTFDPPWDFSRMSDEAKLELGFL